MRLSVRSGSAVAGLASVLLLAGCSAIPYLSSAESFQDPKTAGPDYEVQGEYLSTDPLMGGQVVALGDGDFDAILYRGGLPGEGWDGSPRVSVEGERGSDGRVRFAGAARLSLEDGELVGRHRRANRFE